MIRLAPATPEDFAAIFGAPALWRIRGVTAHVDDVPAAIGGLTYAPDGAVMAFYAGREAVERFPVAIHRAVRTGLAEARARGVRRITTLCDARIAAAERWLARLGFTPLGDDVWIWEG